MKYSLGELKHAGEKVTYRREAFSKRTENTETFTRTHLRSTVIDEIKEADKHRRLRKCQGEIPMETVVIGHQVDVPGNDRSISSSPKEQQKRLWVP